MAKLTTAERIRRYMETHPKLAPREIAQELGVSVKYIHVLRSKDKKAKALGLPIRRVKRNYTKRITLISKSPTPDTVLAPKPENTLTITMIEPSHDSVNHPAHYKVGGIETIDFIEAKKLGYNLGNVIKYITRADHKGNRKQDLAKAMWYLKREIEAQ